jgi:hypothetical protein
MQVSEATRLWLEYHRSHSKKNSTRAYKLVLTHLCEEFGATDLKEITTERVLSFLNRITEGRKRQTKRTRYSHLLGHSSTSLRIIWIRTSGIPAIP